MTDRINSGLAALLTPSPSRGVQFSQARVLTWDNETLHNTLEWRGITITDIPIVEGINALVIRPGDIVGMLGWAPENAKGVGSWWILGKLSNPGEFVADIDVTAKIFRFVTENGDSLAFFGKEADGDPSWILYYGESDNQSAIRIINNDYITISDRSGHEVFATDGATQVGLSRPYLHYHMAPTVNAMITGTVFVPSTASAAYVSIYEGRPVVWHPEVTYDIGISATGVTDWRLLANGTVVFTGSPSANGQFAIPGWGTTVLPGHTVTFTLEARNTGAGFTRVMVRRFEGRQS